jgi:hypothetical protein
MPKLYLTPETVKRMSELKSSEVMQGFGRDGTWYMAGRDGDHIQIEIVE